MSSAVKSFRWLVVGGGAAGCWLARRLAESNSGTVGLIEAGGAPRDARTVAPAWYPRAQGTRLDWAFRTQPQKELGGRQLAWPRGRGLGGSSAINALIYLLPARGDLQRWSRLVGGRWTSELAAAAERFAAAGRAENDVSCPISRLNLAPVSAIHPWCQAFLEAAASNGLVHTSPWIQSRPGVCGRYWLTQQNGRRQMTADPLLPQAKAFDSKSFGSRSPAGVSQRPSPGGGLENLSVITGCQAERLTIRQGRAVGVEVRAQAGADTTTLEAEEIILAAGAIGTPAVLLRSGIGPAAELQAAGVRCRVDAPEVGGNLQDHLVMPIVFQMRSCEGLPYRFSPADRQRFRDSGSGPLASNIAEVGALFGEVDLPGASASEASSTPRFQLHVTPTHYLKYPRLAATAECMSIAITPLHPGSRGRLRLASSAIGNHGLEIDPQYLSQPGDIDEFSEAFAWISELVRTAAMTEPVAAQILPSPARSDRSGLSRIVRAMAQSIYHPVGTCRAGSDDQSVVDDRFCVRGVAGLRVADASVLPDLPSGNTMAAALLMAELAAGQIVRR